MIFSDGSYIPTFIIFSAIGIIIKCAPVEYPLFHKSFPFHSYYGFRFSLPVDINEKNFRLATVIKINPKTVKIRFEDNREIKNCLSKNLQRLDEILNDFIFDIEHAIAKYDNELKHKIGRAHV